MATFASYRRPASVMGRLTLAVLFVVPLTGATCNHLLSGITDEYYTVRVLSTDKAEYSLKLTARYRIEDEDFLADSLEYRVPGGTPENPARAQGELDAQRDDGNEVLGSDALIVKVESKGKNPTSKTQTFLETALRDLGKPGKHKPVYVKIIKPSGYKTPEITISLIDPEN